MNPKLTLFVALLASFVSQSALAIHLKGGTLSWHQVRATPTRVVVQFEVFINFDASEHSGSGEHFEGGTGPVGPDGHPTFVVGDRIRSHDGDEGEPIGTTKIFWGDGGSSVNLENDLIITAIDEAAEILTCKPANPLTVRHTYSASGTFTPFLSGQLRDRAEELAGPRQFTIMRVETTLPIVFSQTSENQPPSFTQTIAGEISIPHLIIIPRSPTAQFQAPIATDPNGNTIKYRFVADEAEATHAAPSQTSWEATNGLTIHPDTGVISWDTSQFSQTVQTYAIQVVAEDFSPAQPTTPLSKSTIEFQVWINDEGQTGVPEISIDPDQTHLTVFPGSFVNFKIVGTDNVDPPIDEQSRLRIIVPPADIPTGATLSPRADLGRLESEFRWTPTTADVGTRVVHFIIEDEDGNISPELTVTIEVIDPPPLVITFSAGPAMEVPYGEPLTFTITGTCADAAATLTLKGDSFPANASVSPALPLTGLGVVETQFTWTPTLADSQSSHFILFTLEDSFGRSTTTSVEITVVAPPLVLTVNPDVNWDVQPGATISFAVTGTCAIPGLDLTLSSAPLPAGATLIPTLPINGTESVGTQFTWTPQLADAQQTFRFISFTLTDEAGRSVSKTVFITLNAHPIELTVTPSDSWNVTPGTPVSFTVSAACADPQIEMILDHFELPPGATLTPSLPQSGFNSLSSQFQWTPAQSDMQKLEHSITFHVQDNLNRFTFKSVSIRVCPPPPSITLTSPLPIVGTAWQPMELTFECSGGAPIASELKVEAPNTVRGNFNPPQGSSPLTTVFTWIPPSWITGSQTFQFTVRDEWDQTASVTVPMTIAKPTSPSWWIDQNVLASGAPANNFAMANQGQLKSIATKAFEEFALHYSAFDSGLISLVNGFSQQNNYAPVTQGQLKHAASHFYHQLQLIGMLRKDDPHPFPWSIDPADDTNHAPATIGQIKRVFAFPIPPPGP